MIPTTRTSLFSAVLLATTMLSAPWAEAMQLCATPQGRLRLRESCLRRETVVDVGALQSGGAEYDIPLENWQVPLGGGSGSTARASDGLAQAAAAAPGAGRFTSLTPCRMVDTRPLSSSALVGVDIGPFARHEIRTYDLDGFCGVPSSAIAISANLTVVSTEGPGFATIGPGGEFPPNPTTASIIWEVPTPARISNADIYPLNVSGEISVYSARTTNVIIDVNGYFDEPSTITTTSLVADDVTADEITLDGTSDTALDLFQQYPATIDDIRPPTALIESRVGSGIDATTSTLALRHNHASGIRNLHTLLDILFTVNSGVDAITTGILVDTSANITADGIFNAFIARDTGVNVARIDHAGAGYFNGGTFTAGADFAESVEVDRPTTEFEPGDLIVIDPEGRRRFALSEVKESALVAGIYSTKPGVLARPKPVADGDTSWRSEEIPLAITGIVPTKVTSEGGKIRTGDLLVTASAAGHAMRAPEHPKPGTIVGKALEPLDGDEGKIEVLVALQ